MTDEQLVAAYVDTADHKALDRLVERHLDSTRRLAYSLVLNHVDADDLVQEVFVRAVRGLQSFRGDAAFSTWLHRITLNTCYRFLAQRRRRAPSQDDDRGEPCESKAAQPEQVVLHDELDEMVSRSLAELAPELRSAIVLTVFQGMTPADAARLEGVTRVV